MSMHDQGFVSGFMSGVCYAHDVDKVHLSLGSADRHRNRRVRVVNADNTVAYVLDPWPMEMLTKSIATWWERGKELGRIYPTLQTWVWRDRECFLECAGHTDDAEMLLSLLPAWPEGWAKVETP